MLSNLSGKKVGQFLLIELPPLVISLVVAELFFKFHSFLLETTAFLALWFVLRFAYSTSLKAVTKLEARPKYNLVGLLYLQLIPLVVSMAIANAFFAFHSFLLESLSFLALWYVLGVIYGVAVRYLSKTTKLIPAPERFTY